MSFDRIVEAMIKEAMERSEFDNLPGKGKPIDLSEYFETPEELRLAHSVLKGAGMTPREVDLLKEIAELKQIQAAFVGGKEEAGDRKADPAETDGVQPDDGTTET
jgi:hypothetical protein